MIQSATLQNDDRNLLFHPESGMISPIFKRQLELVGTATEQFFLDYSPDHVVNVNELLNKKGWFQKDLDFYKKGGNNPMFKITFQQAVNFLEDEFSSTVTIMPRKKAVKNAVFACGVEPTMHIRFNSLKVSLQEGYEYKNIYFITKNEEAKEEALLLIKRDYESLLNGINFNFVIVNDDLNIFEKGLSTLGANGSLDEGYAIISDQTFATKVEMIANKVLPEKKCVGVAAVPIKDWKVDMKLYGYTETILGTFENATIAIALSLLNFKARKVDAEKKNYEANHS
ncbi:MAG: hypothetical protein Tsb0021_14090 [Chlamydiales bacterium]